VTEVNLYEEKGLVCSVLKQYVAAFLDFVQGSVLWKQHRILEMDIVCFVQTQMRRCFSLFSPEDGNRSGVWNVVLLS
jgi:hypothetical protein